MTRRRPVSSQRNDALLLDAAAAEIVAAGVDRLGMSAVARRAGLTTGALYSRYENIGELAAEVWTDRVRDRHRELLDLAVRSLVDRDRSVDFDRVLEELRSPSDTTLLALEFIVTARRIDELEEVVFADVREWLSGWRAGPRARDPRRRAQVIYALAAVWGVVLHETPSARGLDWAFIMKNLRWSFAQPYDEPADPLVPERLGPVLADTGNEPHNALVDSVATIVARVGYERASATRISRRAGLTAGSIYARYKTKDALIEHAVQSLLATRLSGDLDTTKPMFSPSRAGAEASRAVAGYLSAPRREWRRFRIEALLASRHRPQLARTLDRIQEAAIRDYLDALGVKNDEERHALDPIARFAHATPIGLAFVDLFAPGVPSIDWRLVLVPLIPPT